jgi:hypothetical protein
VCPAWVGGQSGARAAEEVVNFSSRWDGTGPLVLGPGFVCLFVFPPFSGEVDTHPIEVQCSRKADGDAALHTHPGWDVSCFILSCSGCFA